MKFCYPINECNHTFLQTTGRSDLYRNLPEYEDVLLETALLILSKSRPRHLRGA